MEGFDWASIITAIGTIILGYFSYNQYTKNKMTDAKLRKMEEDNAEQRRLSEERSRKRHDNYMIVFGELWNIMYQLKADRVYVVQPHPLGREEMLTIEFEVKRRGVEPMRPHIQQLKICDIAKFSSDLVKNRFMYITNIDEQVEDRYARSILSSLGCQQAIIKRLSNNEHDWVGSIFCEFTKPIEISEDKACDIMRQASTAIQFIIPEIQS